MFAGQNNKRTFSTVYFIFFLPFLSFHFIFPNKATEINISGRIVFKHSSTLRLIYPVLSEDVTRVVMSMNNHYNSTVPALQNILNIIHTVKLNK